jgi:hypothetical protein
VAQSQDEGGPAVPTESGDRTTITDDAADSSSHLSSNAATTHSAAAGERSGAEGGRAAQRTSTRRHGGASPGPTTQRSREMARKGDAAVGGAGGRSKRTGADVGVPSKQHTPVAATVYHPQGVTEIVQQRNEAERTRLQAVMETHGTSRVSYSGRGNIIPVVRVPDNLLCHFGLCRSWQLYVPHHGVDVTLAVVCSSQ